MEQIFENHYGNVIIEGNSITVILKEAGGLSCLIEEIKECFENLKISGNINSLDIKCIKSLIGSPLSEQNGEPTSYHVGIINGDSNHHSYYYGKKGECYSAIINLDLSESRIIFDNRLSSNYYFSSTFFAPWSDWAGGMTSHESIVNDTIGRNMFLAGNIYHLILPNNIAKIESKAFLNCAKLKIVEMPQRFKDENIDNIDQVISECFKDDVELRYY